MCRLIKNSTLLLGMWQVRAALHLPQRLAVPYCLLLPKAAALTATPLTLSLPDLPCRPS